MSDDEDKLKKYLRTLNPSDTSTENKYRNEQYKESATWFGITSQTVSTNIGTIFRRVPSVNLPTELEYMLKNANGEGQSLFQLSQKDAEVLLTKGRSGLFVTFPETGGEVSKSDMNSGKYVATINHIPAENVINWRTTTIGAKTMLSLVVIMTSEEVIADDGYTTKYEPKILELMLIDGIFQMRNWKKEKGKDGKDAWIPEESVIPKDSSGKPWELIPFIFNGAETNDPAVDRIPIMPLAMMNLKHYRNSADNEESVYFGVQNQPYIDSPDVSISQVEKMKEDGPVYYGNRRIMPFKMGVASSPENTQISAEMDRKEQKMIALGARLAENNTAAKTAAQTNGEREGKTSILAMIAGNLTESYTQALKWACRYMGCDDSKVEYEINQDFIEIGMDAQLIQAIMGGFQMGNIPAGDYTKFMKRINIFDDSTPDIDYVELLPTPSAGMM
jgi:hypothetical protein